MDKILSIRIHFIVAMSEICIENRILDQKSCSRYILFSFHYNKSLPLTYLINLLLNTYNSFPIQSFVHFFCLSKRNEPKKKTLFSRYFCFQQNQIYFAKILPRFQDFLTQNKSYTCEKRYQSAALERQIPTLDKIFISSLQLTYL